MKTRNSNPFRSHACIISVLTLGCFTVPSASAATRFWDGGTVDILTNGDGAAIGSSTGANGTWDTTIKNWDAGASPHVAWNNAGNDTAEFNAGTQTATLGADVTVGRINNKGGSTGFTIAEGAGLNSITLGSATTIINVAGNTTLGRTLNVNAEVTGANNLSIQGPTTTAGGAVNLNRVNTFTGTLAIDDTTLRIGNLGTAAQLNSGNYSAAISITSTGAFGYSSSLNQTLGGVISGAGVINKNTAGSILTLTNSNTYTGATTINGGKLFGVVGGNHKDSDVTLNNVAAATYGVSITDNTKSWTCKSLACAAGTLEFNFGAVAPSDTVSPLVVTNLAAFTATPLVSVVVSAGLSPGIYPLMTWGSTSGTIPATPQLTVSNVALGTTPSLSVTGNTLILVISSTAASVVKDDNTLPLNDGNSWVGLSTPTAGEVAKWNNIVTSANTTNLGADTTWTGITIENPNGLVTINGSNTLTVGAATIDIDMGAATADLGLNCPLALGAANVWNVAATRTMKLGSPVSGAFNITKLGAGTLQLGASNIMPDGIGSGNLSLTGTLDLNGNSETLNGLSGSGIIDNLAATTTSTLTVGSNNQTSTFSGILKNTGSTAVLNLTKTGTGTLVLGGVNTLSGEVSVTGGTLAFNKTAPLNNLSGIAMSGGTTLRPDVASAVVNAPITVGATATKVRITAHAVDSSTNTTQIPFTLGGVISGDGGVDFVGVESTNDYSRIDLNAASDYAGPTLITCSDELATSFTLGNQNIFVRLGAENALPVTTVLTLDGGAGAPLASAPGRFCELNLNGNNQTLGGLENVPAGSLRVQRLVNNSGTPATLTVNNGLPHTYAGQLGWVSGLGSTAYNNLNLTKSGVGVQTFNGPLRYAGNTTVTGGTLALGTVNPNNELATVTIGASGVLQLTFAGSDTVDKLFINGIQQPAGTYGHSSTGATNGGGGSLNAYFATGTGTLIVTSGPGYAAWQSANGPTTQTIDLDHDFDGVRNGIEYFLGGTNNTTGFTAVPGITNTLGTLSITWPKAGTYLGTYGTDFWVETSATLTGVWTPAALGAGADQVDIITVPGDVKYTFPTGTTNFARLKVTGP